MSNISFEKERWRQIARRAPTSPIAKAFEPFANEWVYLLRVPYGTKIIEDGKFNWSCINGSKSAPSEFSAASIPLGLIVANSVELYTEYRYPATVKGRERDVLRSVPEFLLREGEFFGLFETFAPDFPQAELNGSAGGTTLVVLPYIGNREKFGKLKGTFTDALFEPCEQEKSKNTFKVLPADIDNIRSANGSDLSFGQFFASLLSQANCPWRTEIALFPNAFVERIRRHPEAIQAMFSATISQLSLTCARLSLTDKLNRNAALAVKDHVLAVSLIARGYRPGFVAVLESALDRLVLPAKAIHKLFYDLEICDRVDGKDFFPAIFRPSFATEPAYYFLNRPYFRSDSRERIAEQLAHIISEADKHNGAAKHFAPLNEQQLRAVLEIELSGSDANQRPVCFGESWFLSGGGVAIKPLKAEV